MLLQDYEPTSLKLFSKCARNQASRFSQNKRMYSVKNTISSSKIPSEKKKQKKNVCPFDMTESREQREKKYMSTMSPAVGQYNPTFSNKIKLNWDILKIYHKKNQNRKGRVRTQKTVGEAQSLKNINNLQTIVSPMETIITQSNKNIEKKQQIQKKPLAQSRKQAKFKPFLSKIDEQKNNRYKTVKSQVDMSRMTGRKSSFQLLTELQNDGLGNNLDVDKSIQYIKSKASLNQCFEKQLSREKLNSLVKQKNGQHYSYDYSVLKPKGSRVIEFHKTRGRQQKRKNEQSLAYSYIHYDYNKYVWQAKSNVYPNTKVSINNFNKQTNRTIFV